MNIQKIILWSMLSIIALHTLVMVLHRGRIVLTGRNVLNDGVSSPPNYPVRQDLFFIISCYRYEKVNHLLGYLRGNYR